MATDLDQLPEDGTQTGTSAGIDQAEAYANDPANATETETAPGVGAGIDQAEAYANDPVNASPQLQPSLVTLPDRSKDGFFKKNKTKVIVSSIAGGTGLVTLFGIFFFLLLFKNIHIKNLFIDYEFAKFNRGFNKRITQLVEEAKVTAPDPTAEAGTPEANLKEIKTTAPEALTELESSPKALESTVKSTSILDQSSVGTGGEVAKELGVSRSVPDETGKTDEQAKTDTQEKVKAEVNGNESVKDAPVDAIDEAAKDINEQAKDPNVTNEALTGATETSTAVKDLSGKLFSGVQQISGPFIYATFACLAREIFELGYTTYATFKLHGMAQTATTTFKYADAQKQGKASMSQISAIAEQSDNGTESFTDTCAYADAAHQPRGNCVPIEDKFKPQIKPSGTVEKLLEITHTTLNIHVTLGVKPAAITIGGIDDVCKVVLTPAVQYLFAGLNIGTSFFAALTGAVDFGASDVAVAAIQTSAQIFGTKAGKALAVDAAAHYGGALFKGKLSPLQWGNLVGGGTKVLASDSYRKNGGRRLSPTENKQLALAIRADQIKSDQQKGLAWRLWGNDNPRSLLAMTVYQMPTTPAAIARRSTDTMVAAFTPSKLVRGISQLLFRPQNALAADTVESDTYGIPDYGFTDEELNKYGVVENSKWVRQHILNNADTMAKYDKCFNDAFVELIGDGRDGTRKYDYCNSGTDDTFLRYRLFKLDSRASGDLKILLETQKAYAQ